MGQGKKSQPSATPPRTGRGSRYAWWGAMLAAALLISWGTGLWSAAFHWSIARAMDQRNYDQAEDLLSWCRTLYCHTAETSFWEARWHRKLLQLKLALEHLEEARKGGFDPERVRCEALLLQAQAGQIRGKLDELGHLLRNPGPDGAEICEAYVNGTLMTGETELALALLHAWKTEFPGDAQPHYSQARLLEFQGRLTEAEKELRTALEKQTEHWPARYTLGRLLLDANRPEEAEQVLSAAVAMKFPAAPMYLLAKSKRAGGHPEEALRLLMPLAELPESQIRRSFNQVGEPERGRPIEQELGQLEAARGNHAEAVRWFDLVLKVEPRNSKVRYARALSLSACGQTELAEAELAEVARVRQILDEVDALVDVVQASPAEPHVEERCRIGELYVLNEDGRRGEYWLKEALRFEPYHRRAHQLLGAYYAELAQHDPDYAELAQEHLRLSEQN